MDSRTPSVGPELRQGSELPVVEKTITQAGIEEYAEASGDFNPIHVDFDFAASTQFGGTIAHGMMVAASLSEMMVMAFGEAWAESGRMKIRFRAPVSPGETVRTFGRVKSVRGGDDGRTLVCSVGVRKAGGETAISGDASVALPPKR